MFKRIFLFAGAFCLLLLVVNCAKRGTPTGGIKDEDPPEFVNASPPNYTTNFDDDEIRIDFNELIKLNELSKNLIISPPIKPEPLITPLGGAAKYIRINLEKDTLRENTTYVFNFGNSVVDNNEGNPYSFFKYVMSTGDYIDSLTVNGEIRDALQQEPDEFVTVMLYEADTTYNDSIIFKEVPRYVTNTLDSATTFELTNLRAGRYRLAALKDEASDYKFQPDKDKIAFLEQIIEVPKDTSYVLTLFKEADALSLGRPVQTKAQRIAFPITGNRDSITIELLNDKPANFEKLVTYKEQNDSLRYWYKPKLNSDSLIFKITAGSKIDTSYLRKRDLPADSLYFNASNGVLLLNKPFTVQSSIPIAKIDSSKIRITMSDSVPVNFTTEIYPEKSSLDINFETEEAKSYQLTLLPEALTDFFGTTNDTLIFETQTKELADYSDLSLTLQEAENYPYIVQLVTADGDIIQEKYATEGQSLVEFNLIDPGKYYARLILDKNENEKYDTGSYLKQLQPEKIIYYPKLLDARAGWVLDETFILTQAVSDLPAQKDPDLPEN